MNYEWFLSQWVSDNSAACAQWKYLTYDMPLANGIPPTEVSLVYLVDDRDFFDPYTEHPTDSAGIICNCVTTQCFLPGAIFLPVSNSDINITRNQPYVLAHEFVHYLKPGIYSHAGRVDSVAAVTDDPALLIDKPSFDGRFVYTRNDARCFTDVAGPCSQYQYVKHSTYPTPAPGCGGGCTHP